MLAMSACGTEKADGPSNLAVDAKTLAQQTQQKVKEAETVRITGGGTADMGDGETMEIRGEMCVASDKTMKSTISYGDKVELEMLGIDRKTYVRASRESWDEWFSLLFDLDSGDVKFDATLYEEMLKLLDNRWTLEEDESDAADEEDDSGNAFAELTDVEDLFGENYDKVVKGEPVEYDGKSVIPLSATDEDTDEVTTVYVPEKGNQIPVRITYETPGTPDKADFKVKTGGGSCGVKAPPADQLADQEKLDKLEGKVFDFGDSAPDIDEDPGVQDPGVQDIGPSSPDSTDTPGAPTVGSNP